MQGLGKHLRRWWRWTAAGSLALGIAGPAAAATIDIETTQIDGETLAFITIEGDLEFGDELRFADLAIGVPKAAVFFASAGGSLHAGIEIGRAIRLKGFATIVADPRSCASACALAWLGGTPRFMAVDYGVGFHAATIATDPARAADSVGNALVGAYLNQLGMTPAAIRYMTEAQPHGMQWMSFADAAAVGIEVVALAPVEPAPAEEVPSSTDDDWASYGDWIQIYSRQSLSEAVELGMAYRREFPGTFVFSYDNGWYVVALGPFASGTAARQRDRLIAARRIPRDSLVNRGERFQDLVWGDTPRGELARRPAAEALALAAAEEFFAATSRPQSATIAYLAGVYPARLRYFGRWMARADVMREKEAFVARWPDRRYILRDGAIVSRHSSGTCTVDGLVDWRTYSAQRKATSTGTARFKLMFRREGGGLKLVGEESEVITRTVR